ncbi:Photosynthetic NDH subcomplex B 3 [Quillaja saponaria]|uniref:Photosynthetic NDH subcomplex B 3 n=1 Tax=Quillaja saponaria TaxID=32244 RepID=A0AAD7PPS5_QUISA|nr:Photosynthetic NDH subcomplex B 3 [Quillaja saponaria]
MGSLQLSSYGLSSSFSPSNKFKHITKPNRTFNSSKHLSFLRTKIRAVSIVPEKDAETTVPEEPPSVSFAFVHSVLLPDGTPDVHFRTASGGQDLRGIMLDSNIDLYGPYARPLLNCAGSGTCATCLVEVVEGKEILNPRTDKEKDKLKKKPKNLETCLSNNSWQRRFNRAGCNPATTGMERT